MVEVHGLGDELDGKYLRTRLEDGSQPWLRTQGDQKFYLLFEKYGYTSEGGYYRETGTDPQWLVCTEPEQQVVALCLSRVSNAFPKTGARSADSAT